jgi:hypothetical protein
VGLQVDGHLTDFVKEQGAAISRLDLADHAAPTGAGEGALGIAEQLAGEQFAGEAPAVEGHEGRIPGCTGFVDAAGKDILAHSGLAQQQHRHPGLGQLLGTPHRLQQGGRFAHDTLERPFLGRVTAEHSARYPAAADVPATGQGQHGADVLAVLDHRLQPFLAHPFGPLIRCSPPLLPGQGQGGQTVGATAISPMPRSASAAEARPLALMARPRRSKTMMPSAEVPDRRSTQPSSRR